jgi:DNA-binding XRE family transcriptional regulator
VVDDLNDRGRNPGNYAKQLWVFATNLRRLRHEKGLSQDDLAYEAEVSGSHLSQLEKGRRAPSTRA